MPEPTTRLAEIRAREAAATSGPWAAQPGDPGIVQALTEERLAVFGGSVQDYRDADFTAHARDDVPYLLAQLRLRDAEIAELQTKLAVRERQLSDMDAPGWVRGTEVA